MAIGNKRPSEVAAIVATLDPVAVVNAEKLSDWVDVRNWEQVAFYFQLGDWAAETIDFKLEQAQDASATGKKDLLVGTQLAASATANDGTQHILQTRAEELDIANGFYFVRARIISGSTAGGIGAILGLGFNARYGVGTDLSTVGQITSA